MKLDGTTPAVSRHDTADQGWNRHGTAGSPVGELFLSGSWLAAWEGGTAEEVLDRRYLEIDAGTDGPVVVPLSLTGFSPFWRGYELDGRMPPIWSAPVAFLPSVYSISGALNAVPPRARGPLVDAARAQARQWGAQALVVTNLEGGLGADLARLRPPDALVRLDATCRLRLDGDVDAYYAALSRNGRSDLRRRWRRAHEQRVRFRELVGEDAVPALPRFVELTSASAERHDIPPLYDLPTLRALARGPGARLFAAERDGRMLAGLYSFQHGRSLVLWAGGIDYTALRDYHPYVFLVHDIVELACARRWTYVDFGRGNFGFKGKYGFAPIELWSAVYLLDPSPEVRDRLRERLARMHAGISRHIFGEETVPGEETAEPGR